jgi:hypothetical protein
MLSGRGSWYSTKSPLPDIGEGFSIDITGEPAEIDNNTI